MVTGRLRESYTYLYSPVMDTAEVTVAIASMVQALRADGADLVVESVDPGRAVVRLRLDVTEATCQDCVLPPQHLADVLGAALRERLAQEFELELDDPRGAVRQLVF
jgi:hypothetical protein